MAKEVAVADELVGGTEAKDKEKNKKAAAVALEEGVVVRNSMAVGVGGKKVALGDMEVSLSLTSPFSSPSQHTDKHGTDQPTSAHRRGGIDSSRSPTSQFEYDILDATHRTLDFDSLHISYSFAQFDEEESISSEESLKGHDKESISSDEVSTHAQNMAEDIGSSEFVDKVCSQMECITDLTFSRLTCAFPELVENVDGILSNDLPNLILKEKGMDGDGGGEKLQ